MKRSTRRYYLFFLAAVFLAGSLGKILVSPHAETIPLSVTVRTEPIDNALADAITAVLARNSFSDSTLDGIPMTGLKGERMDCLLEGEKGERYKSRLLSSYRFTMQARGEIREGHFFSHGVYLPVGKRMLLENAHFSVYVRIFQVERG